MSEMQIEKSNLVRKFILNSNKTVRILHLDDDENFLYLSKVFLEKFSKVRIEVDSICDSIKFLEIYQANHYDIIITDYKIIHGKNSLNLLDGIRKARYDLPIIILTGTASRTEVLNGLNHGVNILIQRSPDFYSQFTELVCTISKLLR